MRVPMLSGALLVALAVPLLAQPVPAMGGRMGGPPMGGQLGGPRGPRAMAPDQGPGFRNPAGRALAQRQALALTAEQVTRLEALAVSQQQALAPKQGDLLRARADLADAMRGDGDANALRKAMDRMHQLRTDRAVAALRARQETRAVLTAEQKATFDAMGPMARRGPRGMRRGGGVGGRGIGGGRGPGGIGPE